MVNLRKGEIPAQYEARFQPDGTYVPRILFFTPDGEFMEDVYNRHPKADDKYKYFYSSTAQIVDSMILALERYSRESPWILHRESDGRSVNGVIKAIEPIVN